MYRYVKVSRKSGRQYLTTGYHKLLTDGDKQARAKYRVHKLIHIPNGNKNYDIIFKLDKRSIRFMKRVEVIDDTCTGFANLYKTVKD